MQRVFRLNNTLLGRMVIGPLLGQWRFMREDKAITGGCKGCLALGAAYSGTGIVIWGVLYFGNMPWMVMLASYGAMSLKGAHVSRTSRP